MPFEVGDKIRWTRQQIYDVGECGSWTAAKGQTAVVTRVGELTILRVDDPGWFLKDYNGGLISVETYCVDSVFDVVPRVMCAR